MTRLEPEGGHEPVLGLPLKILTATSRDERLLLDGPGWTLSVMCEWRWVTPGGDVINGAAAHAARVLELVGDEIVGVVWFGPPQFGLDPTFDLGSGGEITLLSDATEDNWALSTPGELLLGPVRP